MTQEEKQLLFKDLCAESSCCVIVRRTYYTLDIILDDHWTIKPYLRPMSSMTEEEVFEYLSACDKDYKDSLTTPRHPGVDWLNSHHFDYSGLIEKGLALEAPEGMYKEK